MFGFKKEKMVEITAPLTGSVIDITEVPDAVFAAKIVGDGCAIVPSDSKVVSPIDGKIVTIMDSLHAYCIEGNDGINIMIHIGIDTVNLKGEGFKTFVKVGDIVKTGDLIAEADFDLIKEKGYSTHTPVIILEMDQVEECNCLKGEAKAGETVAVTYKKIKK